MRKKAKKTKKQRKGFAVMSASERSRIARLGGLTAHRMGRAHEFTSEEARKAAKKSAKARRAKKAVKRKPVKRTRTNTYQSDPGHRLDSWAFNKGGMGWGRR
jgi:uncharacterized protein